MNLGVIIAAGGTGTRMGAGSSKQLLDLAGRPVLAHTVAIFDAYAGVAAIVIAIEPDDIERCRAEVVEKYGFSRVTEVVPGGSSRAESVKTALEALDPAADTVLVHDGARPMFPAGLLEKGLAELEKGPDGVVFGVRVVDTIKEVNAGGAVLGTPGRERLWAAQTPQIFRREVLERAYRMPAAVLAQATDDAMLVEIAGGKVKMVMGSIENIKITTPVDLAVAAEILRRRRLG